LIFYILKLDYDYQLVQFQNAISRGLAGAGLEVVHYGWVTFTYLHPLFYSYSLFAEGLAVSVVVNSNECSRLAKQILIH